MRVHRHYTLLRRSMLLILCWERPILFVDLDIWRCRLYTCHISKRCILGYPSYQKLSGRESRATEKTRLIGRLVVYRSVLAVRTSYFGSFATVVTVLPVVLRRNKRISLFIDTEICWQRAASCEKLPKCKKSSRKSMYRLAYHPIRRALAGQFHPVNPGHRWARNSPAYWQISTVRALS